MAIVTHLFSSIAHNLSFIGLRDACEITILSSVFYAITVWLKKDTQKNLLSYFYSYCALAFVAHFAQLSTISSLMFLFTPLLMIFFALIHQDTLQRNFITLKNITPARRTNSNWLEQLIRTSLIAVNNNQEILCIIERHDSISDLVDTPCILNADCEQSVLKILLDSQSFDEKKMIWLNAHGRLRGVNTIWNKPLDPTWFAESVQELQPWKQAALFFTTKTDALMFQITPIHNTFTIVVKGKIYEHIDTANTLKFINKYMMTSETHVEGARHYESTHKKRPAEQRNA